MLLVACLLPAIALAGQASSTTSSFKVSTTTQSPQASYLGLSASADETVDRAIDVKFSCANRGFGYYADVKNDCKVFHMCHPTTLPDGQQAIMQYSFFCPANTTFNQKSLTCAPYDVSSTIPCSQAEKYYYVNEQLASDHVPQVPTHQGTPVYPSTSPYHQQVNTQGIHGPAAASTVHPVYTHPQVYQLNKDYVHVPVYRGNQPLTRTFIDGLLTKHHGGVSGGQSFHSSLPHQSSSGFQHGGVLGSQPQQGQFGHQQGFTSQLHHGGPHGHQQGLTSQQGTFGSQQGGAFPPQHGQFEHQQGLTSQPHQEIPCSHGPFGNQQGGSFPPQHGQFGNQQGLTSQSQHGTFTGQQGGAFQPQHGQFGHQQGLTSQQGAFSNQQGGPFHQQHGHIEHQQGLTSQPHQGTFGTQQGWSSQPQHGQGTFGNQQTGGVHYGYPQGLISQPQQGTLAHQQAQVTQSYDGTLGHQEGTVPHSGQPVASQPHFYV